MKKIIPLSVPNLCGNELKYVSEAINTEWISTGGPYVVKFENELAKYVKVERAVSCQNGTSGLHIALLLAKVSNQDEVIVPTLTFIAAVNPVKYVGANPIFMDCDSSLCIDPVKLEEFFENECFLSQGKLINSVTKKHIKAIIVVHIFGNMADMEKIMNIAKKFNVFVIEDATEALGSYYKSGLYKGKYAGTIGNVGVYSFNGNKIITTGGGGMIVSHDIELLERAKHLTTQAKKDELYYTHDEIGYNYRMTNLQAALGLAQLENLEKFISNKQKNFKRYDQLISECSELNMIKFRKDIRANYWFYALYITGNFKYSRDEVLNYLINKGIQVRPVWGLISEQLPYKNAQSYRIENAYKYLERIVNIPCSSNLKNDDIIYVVNTILNIEKSKINEKS